MIERGNSSGSVRRAGRPVRDLLGLGLLALRAERYEDARGLFSEALDREPDNADAWALLGAALVALGRPTDAIAAIERALEVGPQRFLPQLKGAELALRLGDPVTAERRALLALRAARPGGTAEAAARRTLTIARQELRRGIERRATLPGRPSVRAILGLGRALGRLRPLGSANPSATLEGGGR